MTLTVDVPDDLEAAIRENIGGDVNNYAREALAVQMYRDRKLTHGQLQRFLGVSRDNSPMQYLILIECVGVLPALYTEVLTTPQVIEELNHVRTPAVVRAWASSTPDWLKIESPLHIDFLNTLDVGEASAISLARERHADLMLIDERAGTDVARSAGVQAVCTLGVLIEGGAGRIG